MQHRKLMQHRKHGFTLVELLVVIAIIGVLVAMLLPAVQAAREAARRMQCANHQKQFGVAMHCYHAANNHLPPGTASTIKDFPVGYGHHTWFSMIMPYLEMTNIYDKFDFGRPTSDMSVNGHLILNLYIPTGACPSDPYAGLLKHRRFAASSAPEGTHIAGGYDDKSMGASYVLCAGPVHILGSPISTWPDERNAQSYQMGYLDYESPGLFASGWTIYRFRDCSDGLSNTFLMGEGMPSRRIHMMYFNSLCQLATCNLPPNYWKVNPKNCPPELVSAADGGDGSCHAAMQGFNSYHPGVVQMVMGDGRVVAVDETIDYTTWVFLGDKADGNTVQVP